MKDEERPISVCYTSVQKTIDRAVRSFHHTYGGDYEEYRSLANWIFVTAYDKYNSDKGDDPAKWIAWMVWYGLRSHRRNTLKRMRRDVDVAEMWQERQAHKDVLHEIAVEESQDTATVVRLVLDPPPSLNEKAQKTTGNFYREAMYGALLNFLMDYGWSPSRIVDSFNGIREHL